MEASVLDCAQRVVPEASTELRRKIELTWPMWQLKYYVVNVFSERKAREKFDYMHNNPVKAGLADKSADLLYGYARWYLLGKPVGVEINAAV
jgi:putative transposase